MERSSVRSSLSYQLVLHVNYHYSLLLFIFLLAVLLYKVSLLPYSGYVVSCELLLVLVFAPLEAIRLFWGRKGNLTETPAYISFSLLISIPVIALCVYWAFFQSYVLLIEFVLVVIEGALVVIQVFFGIVAVVSMSR